MFQRSYRFLLNNLAFKSCLYQHRTQSTLVFNGTINRFNAFHINQENLKQVLNKAQNSSSYESVFEQALKNSLDKCLKDKKTSIWLYIPMNLSNLIAILGNYGFKYHHAENDQAVLYKWLLDTESKVPRFATHQVGVAGLVYNQIKDEVLVIKDRHMIKDVWKLPGGAADLAEDIQDTAVREVFEETGIKSKFCSILAFRQQHKYPNAHGRSDFYFVCRLKPETFEINACEYEVKMCEWQKLDKLCAYKDNMMLNRVANLIKYAKDNNYNYKLIDINLSIMKSIIANTTFNFYHRDLP